MVLVAGVAVVLWKNAPGRDAHGADGPYKTLPQVCSLLDPAAVRLAMSGDSVYSPEYPGRCRWSTTTGEYPASLVLEVELASAGPSISAVDNARRIFPVHGPSNVMPLAGLADEATERVYYEQSTSEASVAVRAANMLLRLSYQHYRAQPRYLAEMTEVLARQAVHNAAQNVAGTDSDGRPASTRSPEEVARGKHLLEPAEARYRPQPSRAVAPPSWRPGDDTAVMGFFDEFAFKVPVAARCEFLGTHWECSWTVPRQSMATVSLSLRPCSPTCNDEWPFRAVDWPADGQPTRISKQSFKKLEINGLTYRDHVQISMSRGAPRFTLSVQVIVPEQHATTAEKIINDIQAQAA